MFLSENDAVAKIKEFFKESKGEYVYKNIKRKKVTCKSYEDGIKVNCLGKALYKEFLPWGVFWHAVHIMLLNGGGASRGQAKARGQRLGTPKLSFNTIEGHVAHVVYGKQRGEAVFQRISPVAYILIASGVCVDKKGDMEMVNYSQFAEPKS
jgi:hypothetical protein